MLHGVTSRLEWREPLSVLAGWGDYAPALALISDGRGWSYLAHGFHVIDTQGSLEDLTAMLGPQAPSFEGPPFSGGVAGLAAYDFAARIEALDLGPDGAWPRLTLLGVSALLAFDHDRREVWAVGRGEDGAGAARRCVDAAGLMNGTATPFSGQLCVAVAADDPAAFEAAVADVRRRIGEGEIFQANIARRWSGRLEAGASPLDLMVRLSEKSPAPLSAYLRLPDLALVSNSPESFVTVRSGVVTTRPIKGTAPRGANPAEDAVNKAALAASAKDRAENLMIVDLMRNDLARVCEPGSVATPELFRPVTFANVHHLVSTVTAKGGCDGRRPAKGRVPRRIDHRRPQGAGHESHCGTGAAPRAVLWFAVLGRLRRGF